MNTRGFAALGAALLAVLAPLAAGADEGRAGERAEGYRGIWFTLGQFSEYGDKYSGGLGTYTAKHKPLAIYAEEVNKTFFVYGGTTGPEDRYLLCMAGYYDHDRHRVARPVVVHDKGAEGVDDPHDNPSIAMDGDGRIWVFVSGRGRHRMGHIYRSVEPYSIAEFERISEREMTYPQPFWVNGEGFFHFFTKYTDGRELYWGISPDGEEWTEDAKLAGFGGHYQTSRERDGLVFTALNYHPDGNVDRRTNVYYLQSSDMGETWTTVDGQVLDTPLDDPDNAALVYDYEAEGKLFYVNDIDLDEDGRPVIQGVTSQYHQPGPPGSPRAQVLIRWTGEAWDIQEITPTTHNYDTGSFYVEEDGVWRMILPSEPGPQHHGTGGEVALWMSEDGGWTWDKARNITQNSPRNHKYNRRPLNAHPDFYNFWADGDPDGLSVSKLHFTNQDGSRVWTLPYTMTEDYQAPIPWTSDTGPALVQNVRPRQGGDATQWAKGDPVYSDRDIRLTGLPGFLEGAFGVRTGQSAGRAVRSNQFLRFDLAHEAHVFVAYDPRRSALPGWLEEGFVNTGLQVETDSDPAPLRNLYRVTFPAGEVVLGGNVAPPVPVDETTGATYFVFAVPTAPWPFSAEPESATVSVGDRHVFHAELASPEGEVEHQWQRNGMSIPDADGAEFVIEAAEPEDEGVYRVIARDESGGPAYISREAYLAVE